MAHRSERNARAEAYCAFWEGWERLFGSSARRPWKRPAAVSWCVARAGRPCAFRT
ncbi:hypothetical protein [Rhodothermus marinus]|uniref:hypothetical protein n=1 Tax=Rhodothermus marinus TaxID=29549 RepID=UPI0002F2F449|nr:hypothetical protein [Rhodothermus marinus]